MKVREKRTESSTKVQCIENSFQPPLSARFVHGIAMLPIKIFIVWWLFMLTPLTTNLQLRDSIPLFCGEKNTTTITCHIALMTQKGMQFIILNCIISFFQWVLLYKMGPSPTTFEFLNFLLYTEYLSPVAFHYNFMLMVW